jgi:SAM-dependent methyltransferase
LQVSEKTKESHWEQIYGTKYADAVSWYTPHLTRSLELIAEAALPLDAHIIDVGGGASTLTADLLERGYQNLTVLDLSAAALEKARASIGERSGSVRWVVGDVTTVDLPTATYDLWHDRAVFHFLTDPNDRAAYLRQVHHALKPGGRIIVATFGPDGPEKCSGLPVVRYDDVGLQAQFGSDFERLHCLEERHETPWGSEQAFVYCLCRRRDGVDPGKSRFDRL